MKDLKKELLAEVGSELGEWLHKYKSQHGKIAKKLGGNINQWVLNRIEAAQEVLPLIKEVIHKAMERELEQERMGTESKTEKKE